MQSNVIGVEPFTKGTVTTKTGDLRLIRDGCFNDDYIDLCPTCSRSLLEWFKHGNDFTKEGTKK